MNIRTIQLMVDQVEYALMTKRMLPFVGIRTILQMRRSDEATAMNGATSTGLRTEKESKPIIFFAFLLFLNEKPENRKKRASFRIRFGPTMIRYIVVQNRQGKTRLSKWFVHYEDEEKRRLQYEVHRLVNSRDPKFTNFVEFRNHKIIYRRYAGLYFCMCVNSSDNDLAVLEAIHCFVEVLDSYFPSVCELDLMFNFHTIYLILDEIFVAGEIMETCKDTILTTVREKSKLK